MTADTSMTEEQQQLAPDVETMRGTAHRFLAPDARPIPNDEVTTLTVALRGQIEELIPTIEAMTRTLPADDYPSACALACCREADMRLGLSPGYNSPGQMTVAMALAKSVKALCDHYENLGSA
ncbi:DUF6415 family natural product biosynthesis protein [Streptomyces sp. NPDC004237]|uniref:DUF6415 family natural product biosynthesis protein n=1 Tax=Streptomyces sp. NPDC004237 TaxID=3154455 RepID=UPI0033BC7F92